MAKIPHIDPKHKHHTYFIQAVYFGLINLPFISFSNRILDPVSLSFVFILATIGCVPLMASYSLLHSTTDTLLYVVTDFAGKS